MESIKVKEILTKSKPAHLKVTTSPTEYQLQFSFLKMTKIASLGVVFLVSCLGFTLISASSSTLPQRCSEWALQDYILTKTNVRLGVVLAMKRKFIATLTNLVFSNK